MNVKITFKSAISYAATVFYFFFNKKVLSDYCFGLVNKNVLSPIRFYYFSMSIGCAFLAYIHYNSIVTWYDALAMANFEEKLDTINLFTFLGLDLNDNSIAFEFLMPRSSKTSKDIIKMTGGLSYNQVASYLDKVENYNFAYILKEYGDRYKTVSSLYSYLFYLVLIPVVILNTKFMNFFWNGEEKNKEAKKGVILYIIGILFLGNSIIEYLSWVFILPSVDYMGGEVPGIFIIEIPSMIFIVICMIYSYYFSKFTVGVSAVRFITGSAFFYNSVIIQVLMIMAAAVFLIINLCPILDGTPYDVCGQLSLRSYLRFRSGGLLSL